MFHVKHPTFAACPRRSRALPRLRALAPCARPPAPRASLVLRPARLARIPGPARGPACLASPPLALPAPPAGPASSRPPSLARLAPSCLARAPAPGSASCPPARRPRSPHAPSRSRSRPARLAFMRLACVPPRAPHPRLASAPPPPLAGPARLTSRLLPRNPRSRLLHPSCSPVASPFPFVALPMPGLSKSKRYQLRFYQHLHSTSTFATQQLSGRLNDRLSTFTQVTGGFSPRNNRESVLTRPREASMVSLGELNSLIGINET